MTRYKLFRLIATLDKSERTKAEIQLGIEGVGHDSLRLFQSIIKMQYEADEESSDVKAELFRITFPGQPYQDAKMRKLMTKLTRQLEDFLIQLELESDEAIRQQLLARSLSRRSDYRLFKDTVEHRLEVLEGQTGRGRNYYKEKMDLLRSLYFHPETAKMSLENDYFEKSLRCQEWHFTLDGLMAGSESNAIGRNTSLSLNYGFFEAVVGFTDRHKEGCPPVIALFMRLAGLNFSRNGNVDLPSLKAELLLSFPKMDAEEQRMALKLMILYAIPFSNNGDLAYSRFIFDLYQIGIERGLIRHGRNPIETTLYMNIAYAGILVDELDWTADFIKKHKSYLSENDRHNAYQLCVGAWHYKRGLKKGDEKEFKQAVYQLNLIPTRSDEALDLRVRSLKLRIRFDAFISTKEALDDVLDEARSFERYLKKRKTYSASKRKSYLHFISYTRRLAKLVNQPDRDMGNVSSFMAELLSDETCVLRHWLLEKAEALQ
jgi:ASC-1-like (ASCH) protein